MGEGRGPTGRSHGPGGRGEGSGSKGAARGTSRWKKSLGLGSKLLWGVGTVCVGSTGL